MDLFALMVQFFFLIGMGHLLNRCGILKPQAKETLTGLIVNLVLPCNILMSFAGSSVMDQALGSMVGVFFGSIGYTLLAALLNKFCFARLAPENRPAAQFGTMVPNCAFLGTPVCESVYGTNGLMLSSIYQIPERIVVWVFAPMYFDRQNGQGIWTAIKRTLRNPCVISVVIGLALMGLKLEIPEILASPIQKLGNCSTPLCMLLVGQIFSDVKLREAVNLQVIGFCILRLILIPAITLLLCLAVGAWLPAISRNIIVIMAALPAGTMSVIFASKHHMGEHFASKCVVLSTLLSCVTLPCWNYLLSFFM